MLVRERGAAAVKALLLGMVVVERGMAFFVFLSLGRDAPMLWSPIDTERREVL